MLQWTTTKLNKETKKAKELINKYRNAHASDLCELYKSFSNEKYKAFNDCFDFSMQIGNVKNNAIWGNIFYFTYAFETENNKLYVITKNNVYEIDLND